jgi:hypothetical protein
MSPAGTIRWGKINQNDGSGGNLSWKDILFLISLLFSLFVGTPHLRGGLEDLSWLSSSYRLGF